MDKKLSPLKLKSFMYGQSGDQSPMFFQIKEEEEEEGDEEESDEVPEDEEGCTGLEQMYIQDSKENHLKMMGRK